MATTNDTQHTSTQYLDRPEGRLAYDVQGSGPLVVCAPGMGDIRSSFRHLVPALVDAGYRVATVDLRGHGDSDTTFASYDDEALASDLTALVDRLGGPATLVGNSMGAGAAVITAAARPDLVSGLVLVGPFVRNPTIGRLTAAMFRLATARPWARQVWSMYLPSLYAGRKPEDFGAYKRDLLAAMARPGHTSAFSKTTHTTHAPAEAAAPAVGAPALVVMGRLDPDFKDPEDEAAWISVVLDAEIVMVDDAGHYPQAQRPDVVNPAVIDFLRTTAARA